MGMGMGMGMGEAICAFMQATQFTFLPIPLFLLMGELYFRTGLPQRVFNAVDVPVVIASSTFSQLLDFSGGSGGLVNMARGLQASPMVVIIAMFAVVLVMACSWNRCRS